MNNDISDLHPAFEWQHLKQSQHGISYIVKVKITRVGPEEGHNGHINLWLKKKQQKTILNQAVIEKQAAVPDSWYPETRFILSNLQFQVEVSGNADIYSEYSMTILLKPTAQFTAND